MRFQSLCVALVTALSACSSDTAPVVVSGTWVYNSPSVSVSPPLPTDTCSISGLVLNLVQQGGTLTGTYDSGTITCNDTVTATGSGAVVNGSISGTTIAFEFDTHRYNATYAWANRGIVNGTSMSGTTGVGESIQYGSSFTLSGDWSAHR